MKRIITIAVTLVMALTLGAQEKPANLKFYGFIRNFFAFDTRESVSGTEDFFYYVPKDKNMVNDVDLNAHPSFRRIDISSRS